VGFPYGALEFRGRHHCLLVGVRRVSHLYDTRPGRGCQVQPYNVH
jgi:hypothetical protein